MDNFTGEMLQGSIDNVAESMAAIAEALNRIADALAADEPLNYSLARSLDKVAESISTNA